MVLCRLNFFRNPSGRFQVPTETKNPSKRSNEVFVAAKSRKFDQRYRTCQMHPEYFEIPPPLLPFLNFQLLYRPFQRPLTQPMWTSKPQSTNKLRSCAHPACQQISGIFLSGKCLQLQTSTDSFIFFILFLTNCFRSF